MENVIRIGSVVYSKRGRDAGGYFMVSEIRDADFVFIADGHTHKLARPQKEKYKTSEKQRTRFGRHCRKADCRKKSVRQRGKERIKKL